MNRAEFQNAVRDLLALDVDVAALLPADDMSYGFDNMAGVLKITPSLLERYLAAARHISRVAVGNAKLPPTAETFRLKADLAQDNGFDELPIGTRGGTAIKYQFPLDGDYTIAIEPLGGGAEPHELEVSVDGARVKLFTLSARRGQGAGQGYDSEGSALEVRVPIKAGPRVVAVTFVRKTSALVEGVREPFLVTHAEGDTRSQPAVGSGHHHRSVQCDRRRPTPRAASASSRASPRARPPKPVARVRSSRAWPVAPIAGR